MEKLNTEVLLSVSKTGSFRKTAELLGYTQAGISYIINSIEEDTGLILFSRDRAGVRLTPEGEALLPYIQKMEILDRQFHQAVDDLKGLRKGSVRVLIFNSISIHWIPGILRRFLTDYPGITVELISEEDSVHAEEMLLNGEADCAFFLTSVHSNLEVFPLMEENLMAVVSLDHPLADCKVFPVSELGNYPYIGMKYDEHTGISNIFHRHGITPNPVFLMDNDNAAISMASNGLGYCIFAELVLQNIPYNVKCLKFDEPQKRTISISTRSMNSCSKACQKFIEYTMHWVKENVKSSLL